MKSKVLGLIAVLSLTACATIAPPPPPPPAPIVGGVGITVTPPQADLTFLIGVAACGPTDDRGIAFCVVPAGTQPITNITGLPTDNTIEGPTSVDVLPSDNVEIVYTLHRPVPAVPALTVDHLRFVEDGHTWVYKGFTDFRLYDRFLRGEDIRPLLQERAALGANTLRVLGMSHCWENNSDGSCKTGVGLFHPQDHADYYDRLRPFADYVAGFGLRLEFVVFADAQEIMADTHAQETHIDRVMASLSGATNVLIEVCNEPFKNLPGGDAAATALMLRVRGRGLLVASGNYNFATVGDHLELASGDYVTTHPDRKPEWPRTSKDAYDLRDGFAGWTGFHKPVISDEPMGADEVSTGSRSNVADDFAYFAAESALAGAGSTFHSTDGLYSRLLRPLQRNAAVAFFQAISWVPADAQLAGYQRGDAFGGPGVNNMPLEHTDALALRTFCKLVGGEEYCVVIRPAADWTATPRDGWHIINQSGPRGALVHLGR